MVVVEAVDGQVGAGGDEGGQAPGELAGGAGADLAGGAPVGDVALDCVAYQQRSALRSPCPVVSLPGGEPRRGGHAAACQSEYQVVDGSSQSAGTPQRIAHRRTIAFGGRARSCS